VNRQFNSILISVIYFCISISCWASHYGPGLIFHKPYNPEPQLGTIYTSYCVGKTSQGYNRQGQTVPFLQEYGSENLLRRFIDPTVPNDNTESLGVMKFSGTLGFERLNLFYFKNIHHNCFIGIGTVIQNLQVDDITPEISLTKTLTPTQEKTLEILITKIPQSLNTSGMLTTAIEFGFNKVFDNLESVNFFQLFLKGSIATPQAFHGHNLSILQYPLGGNISFAYPMTAIINLGIHKHINFGIYSSIIPFQPRQVMHAPINNTNSHNSILLTETAQVIVYPKPVLSSAFYIEIHNFVKNMMLTAGYGSSTGMPWKIHAMDQNKYPDERINSNELLNGWNIASIFAELDYSFRSEKHPLGPTLSLAYVFPISGRYFPKISIVSGTFNLGIHYDF
jgi:hypothetical protein